MTDERGGRYFREARFFLAGDKVAAQSHILEARGLMGYMRDMQSLGGPPIQVQRVVLQDGTRIKATMMNGQFQAEIISGSLRTGSELKYERSFWFLYPTTSAGWHAFLPKPPTGFRPTSLSAASAYGGELVCARASEGAIYIGYAEDGGMAAYPNTKQLMSSADDTTSVVLFGGRFLFYRGAVFDTGLSFAYGLGIAGGCVVLATNEDWWPNATFYAISVEVLEKAASARAYKLTTPFVGGDSSNGAIDAALAPSALPLNSANYVAAVVGGTFAQVLPRLGAPIPGTNRLNIASSGGSGNATVTVEVRGGVSPTLTQVALLPDQAQIVNEYVLTGTARTTTSTLTRDYTGTTTGPLSHSCTYRETFVRDVVDGGFAVNETNSVTERSAVLGPVRSATGKITGYELLPVTISRTSMVSRSEGETLTSSTDADSTGHYEGVNNSTWVTDTATASYTASGSASGVVSTVVTTTVSFGVEYSYVSSVSRELYNNSSSTAGQATRSLGGATVNSGGTQTNAHTELSTERTALLVYDPLREVAATAVVYNGAPVPAPVGSPTLGSLRTVRINVKVLFRGVEGVFQVFAAPGTDVLTYDSTVYTPLAMTLELGNGTCATTSSPSSTTVSDPAIYTVPSLFGGVTPMLQQYGGANWVGGNGYAVSGGVLVLGLTTSVLQLGGTGAGDVRFCKVIRIVAGPDGDPVLEVQDAYTALGVGAAEFITFQEVLCV